MSEQPLAGPALEHAKERVVDPVSVRAPLFERRRWSRRVVARGLYAAIGLLALPAAVYAYDAPPVQRQYWTTALLHGFINDFRAAHGLHALARSVRLDQSADVHAVDMARYDFVSHTSSNGQDLFGRIASYYPYQTWIGENVAAGFDHPATVFEAWIQSPAHRENILRPEFWALGMACVERSGTTYGWYWTVDFGGHID